MGDGSGPDFAQVLDLFYVLLALSVIISVFGMINTLVLAVFERPRELGMLRAIGLHKSRPGSSIRHLVSSPDANLAHLKQRPVSRG